MLICVFSLVIYQLVEWIKAERLQPPSQPPYTHITVYARTPFAPHGQASAVEKMMSGAGAGHGKFKSLPSETGNTGEEGEASLFSFFPSPVFFFSSVVCQSVLLSSAAPRPSANAQSRNPERDSA